MSFIFKPGWVSRPLPIVSSPTTFDPSNKGASVVLSNGNLDAQTPNSGASGAMSIYAASGHKFYAEISLINQNAAGAAMIGIAPTGFDPSASQAPGFTSTSIGYRSNGSLYQNSAIVDTFSAYTIGDTVSILMDFVNDTVSFWLNGTPQGSRAAGDDLDDKLKKHDELIKSLKEAYGEVGKGIDVSVKQSIAVLQTLLGLNTQDLQKELRNLSNAAVTSMTDFTALGDAAGINIETTSRKFAAFKGPIDDFRESIRNGTPDVRAFRVAVSEIEQTTADEKTKRLAHELLGMVEAASSVDDKLQSMAKTLRSFGAEALAAAEQGEAFAKALKALDNTVTPKLTEREKILQRYEEALVKADGTESRLAATRSKNAQLAILADNERKEAAEKNAKDSEAATKRFESSLVSITKRTAEAGAATAGVGMGAMALSHMIEEVGR